MHRVMNTRTAILITILTWGGLVAARAAQEPLPTHPPPPVESNRMVLQMCDGHTWLALPGLPAGSRLTPEQAQQAASRLMALWMEGNPVEAARWRTEEERFARGSSPQAAPAASDTRQTNPFSARDTRTWEKEQNDLIELGNQLFHSPDLVGSTNGVACAMCHPNGANTHPETYPKYQVQLQRVANLRDMINWCLENPVRAPTLEADSLEMRALEAYIVSTRRGVPLDPGKH